MLATKNPGSFVSCESMGDCSWARREHIKYMQVTMMGSAINAMSVMPCVLGTDRMFLHHIHNWTVNIE